MTRKNIYVYLETVISIYLFADYMKTKRLTKLWRFVLGIVFTLFAVLLWIVCYINESNNYNSNRFYTTSWVTGNITYTNTGNAEIQTFKIDYFNTSDSALLVKLAIDAQIPAWTTASKIRRYYFNIDDPNRILEVKYTPIDKPEIYFPVPRIPWEYRFAADIFDNQNNMIATSEWENPQWKTLFFPPSNKNLDIPIVTLKVDKSIIHTWDSVIFDVITKVLSENKDFDTMKTISYDFDGDWIWDNTTWATTIKHTYLTWGNYTPRIKVSFKWYSGIWIWERIMVWDGKNQNP